MITGQNDTNTMMQMASSRDKGSKGLTGFFREFGIGSLETGYLGRYYIIIPESLPYDCKQQGRVLTYVILLTLSIVCLDL